MQIKFKKTHPNAQIPHREPGNQGFDLKVVADEDFFEENGEMVYDLYAGRRRVFNTGIQIEYPSYHPSYPANTPGNPGIHIVDSNKKEYLWGLIKSRSGMAAKHGIDVGAGVCDTSYRGDHLVCLHNTSSKTYRIKEGDKIAQLIIMRDHDYQMVEVDEIEQTERGDKALGSSGR